jgi:hypothetical protein
MKTNDDLAIDLACKLCHITRTQFLSPLRLRPMVEARQMFYLLLHERGYIDQTIAWIAKRSRPAVSLAREKAVFLVNRNKTFRERYEQYKSLYSAAYEREKSLREAQA